MLSIRTDKPVAYDSPDHLEPWGTAQDNSQDMVFNLKVSKWLGAPKVLDIGCSGGGFVKSWIDRGCLGVGVEGSDYSLKRKRAEWATIPGNLFTADATEPFQILQNGQPLKFNLITAWEFMEHISTDSLAAVASNIDNHLEPNGVVMMSISTIGDVINGVQLHQTIQPQEWWLNWWDSVGFRNHVEAVQYIGADWVRKEHTSFHVVLTRKNEALPNAGKLKYLPAVLAARHAVGSVLPESVKGKLRLKV